MLNAPEVEFGNLFIYDAFNSLITCRNYELAPIPWTAIQAYANEYDIEGDQREFLFAAVHELDRWFLDYLDKRKPKPGKTTATGKRGLGGGI